MRSTDPVPRTRLPHVQRPLDGSGGGNERRRGRPAGGLVECARFLLRPVTDGHHLRGDDDRSATSTTASRRRRRRPAPDHDHDDPPTTTTTTPAATKPCWPRATSPSARPTTTPRWRHFCTRSPVPFLALGDNVVPPRPLTDFQSCYDPYFGSEKARTRPVPGNHEYDSGNASGYLTYFGSQAAPNGTTWYSFDVGNFHFVALDSDCTFVGGCGTTSAQYQWLKADLAASTTPCLIAYFHHTPWSSFAGYGKPTAMVPIMQLLQSEGADAILAGHMHSYERFARMNASGNIDPTGFRTFVVGTGGDGQFALGPPVTGSEARQTGTYGLLRLDLHASSYDWHFVPVAGSTYTDAGTDTC